ncbi:MAG: tyrosine-type recombinase/integrase [Dehalococcoidia bacterium]
MDNSTIPLERLRGAFNVYNRTTNKSPRTVDWYELRLELFERYLGEQPTLGDLTVANVRAFIADLQARGSKNDNNPNWKGKRGALSSSYIQGFARALRAFSSFLYEDGYLETNILQPLRPPKIQRKVIEVLSDEEIGQLLGQFDRRSPIAVRDHAILLTLLDCGLRASELCELASEDAHLDEGYLRVLGKGNKERLVPIGRTCQAALLRWREQFRPWFEPTTPQLFVSTSGDELSVNGLEAMVRRSAGKAGLRSIHPHLLRHTFATTYLVKEVGDPLRLQQVLGHTSLEMVRHYVAAANVQQSLLDRRASPMDLIGQEQQRTRHSRRVQARTQQFRPRKPRHEQPLP